MKEYRKSNDLQKKKEEKNESGLKSKFTFQSSRCMCINNIVRYINATTFLRVLFKTKTLVEFVVGNKEIRFMRV